MGQSCLGRMIAWAALWEACDYTYLWSVWKPSFYKIRCDYPYAMIVISTVVLIPCLEDANSVAEHLRDWGQGWKVKAVRSPWRVSSSCPPRKGWLEMSEFWWLLWPAFGQKSEIWLNLRLKPGPRVPWDSMLELSHPFCLGKGTSSWKTAMNQEGSLTRQQICWHHDLGLPTSRTVRNKSMLFISCPTWCFAVATRIYWGAHICTLQQSYRVCAHPWPALSSRETGDSFLSGSCTKTVMSVSRIKRASEKMEWHT